MIHLLGAVTDPTINFPTTWFTADRLTEFWSYVKWWFRFNMPYIMMVMALLVAGFFGETIIDVIMEARRGKGRSRDDDDDDYDVDYY